MSAVPVAAVLHGGWKRDGIMAYLQTHFWPGGTHERSHVAGPTEGGYPISVVWDSKEQSKQFTHQTLMPALPVDGGFADAPRSASPKSHLETA